MHSCLYVGWLRHRRFAPSPHAFAYRLYMAYLDLDELDSVFRGRWLWSTRRSAPVSLRRRDYFGDPTLPLAEAVRRRVESETGERPAGPIRLLTQLAHFGFCFNPVSFYYCFDRDDTRVIAVLAEITNTPWGERHAYVVRAEQGQRAGRLRARFQKVFHVSPFLPMNLRYDWRFTRPARSLSIHMDVEREQRRLFDATLTLRRRDISAGALAATLMRYPFMPARAVAAIYWQAFRLWLKGTPFHAHPSSAPIPLQDREPGTHAR